MTKLKIADNLTLPAEAVTQTIAILAKRRAGKSYCARRFAEQLFKIGQQVIIVDPKGDWWGIRSSADGKSEGLPITILGGEHGDLPLEAGSGELLASLAVEENVSMLLDLSLLRKNEVAKFMTGFLETLYRLKARERYRTPVMLIIDEADAIAPQKPFAGEERMLGAADDIVRRGGQRGIGTLMACQRPAVLNKNVLTQSEMLIALRTISPQDMEALDEWIKKHGTAEQRKVLMDSLPALPIGDAWFWSPGWPTDKGIFSRVHVLPIETFDSGATPKAGEVRAEPRNLARVDLAALRVRMAATIEKVKLDDPKALRTRILVLEGELRKAQAQTYTAEDVKAAVAVAVKRATRGIHQEFATSLKIARDRANSLTEAIGIQHETVLRILQAEPEAPAAIATPVQMERAPDPVRQRRVHFVEIRPAQTGTARHNGAPGQVKAGLRRILVALAQVPQGLSARQVGIRASISSKSGTFDTYLSRARTEGWLVGDRGALQITAAGIAAIGPFEALPTGRELLNHWLPKLKAGSRRILQVLADAWPKTMSTEEIGARAELSCTSGSFDTYLSGLRSLDLIEGPRAALRASDELSSSNSL